MQVPCCKRNPTRLETPKSASISFSFAVMRLPPFFAPGDASDGVHKEHSLSNLPFVRGWRALNRSQPIGVELGETKWGKPNGVVRQLAS